MPIGLYFPFNETNIGGLFRPTQTTRESIQSDLIAFLTLRRGQRPMNNRLYSPLYDYIFEQFDSISENQLMEDLHHKLQEFFPMIELKGIDIKFVEETNLLQVKIIYIIPSLGQGENDVSLEFETNQQF